MDQKPSQSQGQQPPQIQIKITDDIARGVYSNMAQVGFTNSGEEFVLDFFNFIPPTPMAVARVLISPGHIKRIIAALQDNLKRYEAQFGEIKAVESPDHNIGFRTE